MMVMFFVGIGLSMISVGFVQTPLQLGAALLAIGIFASIYHPVGTAMIVSYAERLGREMGLNGVWGNLGVASSALVTGVVGQFLGWRWAFIVPGIVTTLIGVAFILLTWNVPFGFVANLGVIALFGMIMRNSVILVDQIEQDISAGHPQWNAIVDATVRRFRPIVLTALAAVLAMIPLSRSNFWGPMAVAIMGGLISATILTLLFVPAFFTLMDDLGYLGFRLGGRFIGKADEPAPAGAPKAAITDGHSSAER